MANTTAQCHFDSRTVAGNFKYANVNYFKLIKTRNKIAKS